MEISNYLKGVIRLRYILSKFTLFDIPQAINLLLTEWNLGVKESNGPKWVCGMLYLNDIILESRYMIALKNKNKLIGYCGYSDNNYIKHNKIIYIHNKINELLEHLLNNRQGYVDYINNYEYTPEFLEKSFDGEVSIIILDKQYRGLGLGKKLLNHIFKVAKQKGVERLKILTDESCNYNFYTSLGCKKIYETDILNKEEDRTHSKCIIEKAYIFEKVL